MKGKKQSQIDSQGSQARELPIEEFARLVEGLDADAIERACARDGAPPGGAPPAWSDPAALTRYFSARSAGSASTSVASQTSNAPSSTGKLLNEFTVAVDGRLTAQGAAAAEMGASDDVALEILAEPPIEGAWVAADIPGIGKLLRKLRFVGGAAILCASPGCKLAIPVEQEQMPLLRAVKPASAQR